MPELPEVETVCRGLAAALPGRTITRLELRRADMRILFPPDLATVAAKRRIESVTRRAKYLLLHLSGGITLLAHLGMSGKLLFHPAPPGPAQRHDHAIWHFGDGSVLVFHDPRRFGLLTWTETDRLAEHPLLAHLGPEPLDPACDAAFLRRAFAARRSAIKAVLMDQRVVVGVGNIYACEALYRARLDPWQPAASLTPEQIQALLACVRAVLDEAIASGGSTLRDYVRSSGDAGYFQHRFGVYGREGEPCHTCHTPIARRTQTGRSTFFCPECQTAREPVSD